MLIRRLPQVLCLLLFTSAFGICHYASRAAQTFEIGGKSSQPTQQASAKVPPRMLEERLRVLAGNHPVDCGDVAIRRNPSRATKCGQTAFSDKKPFIVRYWIQGIDSSVGIGVAGSDTGRVFVVQFDSMGWSSEGLKKRQRLMDGNHNIVEPCPTPVHLRITSSGWLACFPPEAKSTHSLMSPY